MDLRLLRAFETVARRQNFGAAATELSISQPALTKQIQALERRVGSALFVRGRQGARLTRAGRLLLPDAKDVLNRADAFDQRVARIAEGAEGSLAIGFGLSSIELAPRAIALFRRRHPGVRLSLDDLSSTVQYERLATGSLQVGFVRLPTPPGLDHLPLCDDHLVLATPQAEVVPDDVTAWLDGQALVRLTTERGPGLAAQIARLYDELGCAPSVAQESADLQTVLALVAAGVGSAVVPATAAGIAPAAVRLQPLPGQTGTWQIGAAWHPAAGSPLITSFLQAAQEA
ncbi:LysR family transcriptional regulator [Kribbella deserti]|uniref:LysR family transcriptional regulator n=1 Tax=Kribbella deserti TaxID=1926257 RepID=A0ABV6QSB0_9ACTN